MICISTSEQVPNGEVDYPDCENPESVLLSWDSLKPKYGSRTVELH
jgi:hypothetical protein